MHIQTVIRGVSQQYLIADGYTGGMLVLGLWWLGRFPLPDNMWQSLSECPRQSEGARAFPYKHLLATLPWGIHEHVWHKYV